jgi:hypothetical protein
MRGSKPRTGTTSRRPQRLPDKSFGLQANQYVALSSSLINSKAWCQPAAGGCLPEPSRRKFADLRMLWIQELLTYVLIGLEAKNTPKPVAFCAVRRTVKDFSYP